jgi:hypothetical protein
VQPDIPRFYFPEGKPIDNESSKTADEAIEKIFTAKPELKKEEFE